MYLRICDALKLDLTDRKHVSVNREQFLNTFFRSESKLMQEEREELWGTKEERLEAHWSQQPPGTRCIFFEKDIKILRNVVLELCDGNIKELTRRIRDDMGIQHITSRRIRAFIENETLETDVELLLALIGVIIGSKPEEVSELIQNKTLAETFRNSMLKKNLVNEENMEWVENLPSDLMREISLENLAEEQQKRIETPEDALTFLEEIREKGIIFGEFYVCITRQEVDKLKDAINKARREENSQKNLYEYTADQLNKHLVEEEINETQIKSIITKQVSILKVELYLKMCSVFGVKPNLKLHLRQSRTYTNYPHFDTSDTDFPEPTHYVGPNGETVTIEEREEGFYIIVEGKKLEARKRKTQYGGKWWGLTIIDYITEKGVYTVVKETGQLWPPYLRPWYTYPANAATVRFKTPQPLEELVQTIKARMGLSYNVLNEITGISIATFSEILGERTKKHSISLGLLLTLLSLKSTVIQTDIKREIQQLEKQIISIGNTKISEQKRRDILYINLKTPTGATLIGHELGDGNLYHHDGRIWFRYCNTEKENTEEVRNLIELYGITANIQTITPKKKGRKKNYHISTSGLLPYAIWCAIPRMGSKTKNNPTVPEWITDDSALAKAFLKAIIKDEAHINPEAKTMSITLVVDVTEKLEKKGFQQIQNIVKNRLHKLREKWSQQETPIKKQRKEEEKARIVTITEMIKEKRGNEAVSEAKKVPCNILLGIKKALQTLKISAKENLKDFYVSKKEAVTARWTLTVNSKDTKKVYEQGLLNGYKKKNYELTYRQTSRRVRIDNWLPETHLAELRRMKQKLGKKRYTTPNQIKKYWNSERYGDIEELIKKHPPKQIEEKKKELEKRGIKARDNPSKIHFLKMGISVEWLLEWFE